MIEVSVKLRGGLFEKNIPATVERALVAGVLNRAEDRVQRQGKGLGARRNMITPRHDKLALEVKSTLIKPRTTGRAYQRKQIAAIKRMAPAAMKKDAERIAREMG